MDPFIAQSVAAIAADTVSGAVEIAQKCAEILARAVRSRPMADRADVQREILTVGRALIRSHPTIAPLVNLVNGLLWRLDETERVRRRCDWSMKRQMIFAAACMSMKQQLLKQPFV